MGGDQRERGGQAPKEAQSLTGIDHRATAHTGREAEEHNLAGVREQPALPDAGKVRRGTGDTVTSAIRGQLRSGVLKHGCTFGSFGEPGTNVDAQATPQAG